ncbi:hypothetical protein O6H91_07G029200 [Diphasiastrum complanatum]|uniref:Uncharacterized protein n=2 Tax=Diphasiastrum complanatum TaxID=34168 RepID=A0ACC2D3J2_DIPCM|nr:hypothetical protein O6H91_07G029200 [Diphasiastrum complanatum]KAJ7548835.1 hypothetical protein O6H91_07G029200 [Diphasiastrum complanatum]
MAMRGLWNWRLWKGLGRSLEGKCGLGKSSFGSDMCPASFSTSLDAVGMAGERSSISILPNPKGSNCFEFSIDSLPNVKHHLAFSSGRFGFGSSEAVVLQSLRNEGRANCQNYLLENCKNVGVSGQQFARSTSLVDLRVKFMGHAHRQRVCVMRMMSTQSWIENLKLSTEKMKRSLLGNKKPKQIATSPLHPEQQQGVILKSSNQLPSTLLKPLVGIQASASRYKEAVRLQLEAFWKRNNLLLVGALGLGVCLLLWRVMFGVASMFVSLSEGMAKFGFLALAAAMVTFSGIYLRARHSINPDAVYRIAMRTLNTSAEVLKILGAPLSGTDVRAYVMSGGGLRLKNFRPRFSSKRCFLIFPVQGSEKRGLVSLETKKKKGQYHFKLLAVDIPTAGADQRLYLIGDEDEYKIAGGLISELRDPIVKAMAAQSEFDAQDEKEDEEDHKKR